jgi:hypothetical protein
VDIQCCHTLLILVLIYQFLVCGWWSHIMFNGSVCIVNDTMNVCIVFSHCNYIGKCEQLMWNLLHILQKLKINCLMTWGHTFLCNSSWDHLSYKYCKTFLVTLQCSMPRTLIRQNILVTNTKSRWDLLEHYT